ncbi:MAG: ATP-binding protein [Nitrospinae bacterium]|nr:ATP-binding protein [Nitrospinota bacterium]
MPLRILPEKDFFGRKEELADLYRRSLEAEKGITQSVFLSGSRGVGKTELLKQLFNNLFWKQDKVAPFYYSINSAILSVSDFSRDYLMRYICQRLAFENKESSLIYREGLSIDGLTSILEERKAFWALEILDVYIQCHEPIDSLRIALNAPHQSTLATGMSVVVMIDEFQRLNNFHISGNAAPILVALFEMPLSFRKTPHLITGNQAEIQEMPIIGALTRMDVQPLQLEDAALMFSSLLDGHGIKISSEPHTLLNHLGGNPFYIKCVARAAGLSKKSEEKDCWRTYINEISDGNIYFYWLSVLKSFFPELGKRRKVLEITNRIYHTGESLAQHRISKAFSLSERDTEVITTALYRAGFVSGEFGVFRAPEDRVLIDFIDCLYMKEVRGKSYRDIEMGLLEKTADTKCKGTSFEMTIPMVREAELVAAQCLEQIGKNLHLDEDVIGQLQMAVIEACINAMEHSKGEDKNIYLSFNFTEDMAEISIESSGRDFVSQETGEPFVGRGLQEDAGRGWGIKLMKNFVDSVRFEKTERGTKVVLAKNLLREARINREGTATGE